MICRTDKLTVANFGMVPVEVVQILTLEQKADFNFRNAVRQLYLLYAAIAVMERDLSSLG